MLLGVVSDTHGNVEHARQGVRMLENFAVERVLHCGDIGSPEIIPLFAAWPTHFVLGNVDGHLSMPVATKLAGQSFHGRFVSLEFAGVKIALLHGDDQRLLNKTIADGLHQLVCHGHTHVARREKIGPTLVLNPGALHRANPHTIAIVRLPELEAEIIPVR